MEPLDEEYRNQLLSLGGIVKIFRKLGVSHLWLGGGFALDFLLSKALRPHDDIDLVTTAPGAEKILEWLKREGIIIETQVPGSTFRFDYGGANFEIEYGDVNANGALVWKTKVAKIGYSASQLVGKAMEIPGTGEQIGTLAPEALYLIKEHIGREKDHRDMKLLETLIDPEKIKQIKTFGIQWFYTPKQLKEIKIEKGLNP